MKWMLILVHVTCGQYNANCVDSIKTVYDFPSEKQCELAGTLRHRRFGEYYVCTEQLIGKGAAAQEYSVDRE